MYVIKQGLKYAFGKTVQGGTNLWKNRNISFLEKIFILKKKFVCVFSLNGLDARSGLFTFFLVYFRFGFFS